MLIPERVCAELTLETASRLHDDRPFVTYHGMDEAAQTYLLRGLQDVARTDVHITGGLKPKAMSLTRAMLFFVRDPVTDAMYSVPWVRSPQGSKQDYHWAVTTDFHEVARGKYPALDTTTYFESQPEAVNGIVTRTPTAATFFGIGYEMLPDEHVIAVEQSQRALADAGAFLHVKIGTTLLRAGGTVADSSSSSVSFIEKCGRVLNKLF